MTSTFTVTDRSLLPRFCKLRLFCITVPLHKVPPLVIAAVPRSGSDNAEALYSLHCDVMRELHSSGIYPSSMAADGTEVERSLQNKIDNSAARFRTYTIPNTVKACSLSLRLHYHDDEYHHPFVTLQDSNHARKTGRNQLFTGARFLSMGNYAMFYAQLRDAVIGVVSPLYHRDVERIDRQDDRAAARLTSAAFLSHMSDLHPERVSLLVYLFILGEMIDAWQNRVISHLERATMVLTVRFVLMAWRSHVDLHPAYSTNIQFISRESFDIFIRICDGLLSMILLHRQHHPTYPLLPWLHGTESCEHIFGILRQLKADFNYMDVLYLQPKLRTLVLAAFSRLLPEQEANATAAGYYHSYVVDSKLDLPALTHWPTDPELAQASERAFDLCQQLMSATGIDARTVLSSYKSPKSASSRSSKASRNYEQQPKTRGPSTLAEVLALYDATSALVPEKHEQEIEAVQAAIASESIDGTLKMYFILRCNWSRTNLKADTFLVTLCQIQMTTTSLRSPVRSLCK